LLQKNFSATTTGSRSLSTLSEDTSKHVQFREPDPSKPKLVLAYSGGLDTSCQLSWLAKEQGYEVCAYIADLGQDDCKDKADIEAICAKAEASGAYSFYCKDLRRPFIEKYLFPCIQANAVYEGRYLLGTSMARPCIAEAQIDICRQEGATHISHGSTGKGNDQVRFEVCYLGMEPNIQCVTLWRDPEYLSIFEGRQDLLDYAEKQGIPVSATKKASYSEDENIMHISYESGELEDPACPPQDGMFKKTANIADCPDTPANLSIDFEQGVPVKVTNLDDGTVLTDSLELFAYLNTIGGAHGCGRIDIVENRFVGMKSRGCYETPGGTVLMAAHLDLETLCIDREVMRIRDQLSIKFAELVYNGYWFSPEMEFLMPSMMKAQECVTGTVNVQLVKGNIIMKGRSSPLSLYNQDLVSTY
jgi:argininosuccinate synthase